jgi:spectinomycin phosphotransferase
MLTPPDDLTDDQLSAALRDGWDLPATSIKYAPVGFGSHHWAISEPSGRRWFLTADRIETSDDLALLRAALQTASELKRAGLDFVIAPVPTGNADILVTGGDYAFSLYRHIDQLPSATEPDALGLVIRLHAVTGTARTSAPADDFVIPDRSAVSATLRSPDGPLPTGPYAARFRDLVVSNRDVIIAGFDHYDRGAEQLGADQSGWVITHGEPKSDNIMITDNGPVLIDWDTVRLAPPARDLWMTGGIDRYTKITGRTVPEDDLELFRLRWDLADLCSFAAWFVAAHEQTPDTEIGWRAVVDICQNRLHRSWD